MKRIRSAHRRKNHIIIIIHTENGSALKAIMDAVRLQARKMRKQLDGGMSFEVYGSIVQDNGLYNTANGQNELESNYMTKNGCV